MDPTSAPIAMKAITSTKITNACPISVFAKTVPPPSDLAALLMENTDVQLATISISEPNDTLRESETRIPYVTETSVSAKLVFQLKIVQRIENNPVKLATRDFIL